MSQPPDPLVAGRLEHYERLQREGLPVRYERSHRAAELHERFADLGAGECRIVETQG